MQRVGIHAAGEHLARHRHHGVIRAGKAGDAIQQDNHVFFVFHHALGFFNHHFGYLHMALRGLVEGGGDYFAAHGTQHFGYFFGAFVNQQHNQLGIGIIGSDGVGDILQHHSFACFGRRNQQGALPETDGRNQVDNPPRDVFAGLIIALQFKLAIGEQRGKVFKQNFMATAFGVVAVHAI